MSLSSLLMASGANEEARRENEALTSELEAAQREHKKLRQVVEQLSRDYEAAKDLDPLRRYQRLKVSRSLKVSSHSIHVTDSCQHLQVRDCLQPGVHTSTHCTLVTCPLPPKLQVNY